MSWIALLRDGCRRLWGTKFSVDVAWTIVFSAFVGLALVTMNVLIGRYYDKGTLGIFNQVFALWVLVSQVSALGMHLSVLQGIAAAPDRDDRDALVSAALFNAAVSGGVACALTALALGLIGRLFGDAVATGWLWALPGLWAFTIDRMLIAALNGFRAMRLIAFVQALRYALIIACLIVAIAWRVPGQQLAVSLTVSELCVCLLLFWYSRRYWRPITDTGKWNRRHFRFGLRGALGDTASEVNGRLALLLLGLFADHAVVGIFALVVVLVDSLVQVSVGLRNNLNPILGRLIAEGNVREFSAVVRYGKIGYYAFSVVAASALLLLFPVFTDYLVGDQSYRLGWVPLAIVLAGMVAASGYLPFTMLLAVGARPKEHTIVNLSATTLVVVGCFVLVPPLGIYGAAGALGSSYVIAVLLLRGYCRRFLLASI